MNFYEAMSVARQWGDTVQFETGKITVTMGDIPRHGVIVSAPSLSLPDGKARMVDVKQVWKAVQHYGSEVTATFKGATLTLSHPTRGKSVIRTAPSALLIPAAPDEGWATLTPDVVERVRNAALAASTVEAGTWGMNGVRVTPSYVAATDSLVIVVVWCATGVTDPATLPTTAVKHLPVGCDVEFAVSGTQGWFRAQDCVYWSALIGNPWPDTAVNDMIPSRRATDSLTIDMPEGWDDAVKGAALTDHNPDNPARLEVSDGNLALTIPNVYSRVWELPRLEGEKVVAFNAHLLLKAVKLLPDDAAYLSIAQPTDTLLLYTAGTNAVEVLVAPCYLPA